MVQPALLRSGIAAGGQVAVAGSTRLLRQNELSLARLPQPIELSAALDPNLVATASQIAEMDYFRELQRSMFGFRSISSSVFLRNLVRHILQ